MCIRDRATGRVELRSNSVVSHVLIDRASGRAEGVEAIDRVSGEHFLAKAPLVVLCASTIESLRLLLHSQQESGLEDVSGQLGRGLMDHISRSCFFSIPDQPAPSRSELSGAGSCFIPNTLESRSFKRGYGLWCGIQRFDPPQLLMRERGSAVGFLIGHGEVLNQGHNQVCLLYTSPSPRDS